MLLFKDKPLIQFPNTTKPIPQTVWLTCKYVVLVTWIKVFIIITKSFFSSLSYIVGRKYKSNQVIEYRASISTPAYTIVPMTISTSRYTLFFVYDGRIGNDYAYVNLSNCSITVFLAILICYHCYNNTQGPKKICNYYLETIWKFLS